MQRLEIGRLICECEWVVQSTYISCGRWHGWIPNSLSLRPDPYRPPSWSRLRSASEAPCPSSGSAHEAHPCWSFRCCPYQNIWICNPGSPSLDSSRRAAWRPQISWNLSYRFCPYPCSSTQSEAPDRSAWCPAFWEFSRSRRPKGSHRCCYQRAWRECFEVQSIYRAVGKK